MTTLREALEAVVYCLEAHVRERGTTYIADTTAIVQARAALAQFKPVPFVGYSRERGGWCVYVQTDAAYYEVLRGPFRNKEDADATLAQPEPATAAFGANLPRGSSTLDGGLPQPPQRAPLTEDQIAQMWAPLPGGEIRRPIMGWGKVIDFARAIEAAHGIWDKP